MSRGTRMETILTDCFWCGEAYDIGLHKRCPQCSTDVNNQSSAASGEDGTTS